MTGCNTPSNRYNAILSNCNLDHGRHWCDSVFVSLIPSISQARAVAQRRSLLPILSSLRRARRNTTMGIILGKLWANQIPSLFLGILKMLLMRPRSWALKFMFQSDSVIWDNTLCLILRKQVKLLRYSPRSFLMKLGGYSYNQWLHSRSWDVRAEASV